MQKRYISLSVVTGNVLNNEPVPLEVAALVLDDAFGPIDDYTTPVIPSTRYDLSMVSMHTPAHVVSALEAEGLWAHMHVNSMDVDAADRYVADKIERHFDPEEYETIVLCDRLDATRGAAARFLPISAKKLDRRDATWVEIEPVKNFCEAERLHGEVLWKYRAMPRAKATAEYARKVRRTLTLGANALRQGASQP